MKRFSYFILFVLLTLWSCSSSDDVTPEIKFPSGSTDYFKTSVDFNSDANEKTITFSSTVPWKATVADTRSGSSWCTVSPSSGEAGQATFKISAAANTTYDDRAAVIRLAYGDSIKNIYVNQKQLDALSITSDRFEIPAKGGSFEVEVKANIDFTINIADDCKNWVHRSSSTRGLVTSKIKFNVDASEEYDKREGTIEIVSGNKKETVKVYQAGEGIITLTKKEFSLDKSEQDIKIEVSSNFEYSVEMPDVDWLYENKSGTRGMSTHTLNLHVKENSSYDSRSTSLKIYDKNSDVSETVTITQNQTDALSVDKKEFSFDDKGGIFEVRVNANIEFTTSIADEWVTQTTTKSTRGLVESVLEFNVSKMTDGSTRETKITISNKDAGISEQIVVKQTRYIALEQSALSMITGDTEILSYTNNSGQSLKWSSSNTNVATVNNDGYVTAIGPGSSTITVTTADGKYSSSCKVSVQNIEDCITINRTGMGTTISSSGTYYSVDFTITNSSSKTIKIISLGGVEDGVTQDLKGGSSVTITLYGRTAAVQNFYQTLIYKYNGKEYKIKG